jgi:protein-S-isoprenylcysteine O-methyltransferase Ste14
MTGSYDRLLGLARLVAAYALVAVMLALARPTPWHLASGALLVIIGETLRVWSAGHLVKNETLVTSGPYRYTRNPLYLGRLLIFTGLCVMARLPYGTSWLIVLAGWAVFFGYYLPRKERVEPGRLRQFHGDAYERYYRAVPALLPVRGAWEGAAAGRWSAARALRNREHWMVVGLAAVLAFLLWRAYLA